MIAKKIHVIGSQMDLGANRRGVDLGPIAIRYAGLVEKIGELGYSAQDFGDIIPHVSEDINPKMRHLNAILEANLRLYKSARQTLAEDAFLVTLGGDHSISCASVAAVQAHFGNIGIIWVDAHGDFNNEDTSPSGNIHGMSLSALCGYGPEVLVEEKFCPVNTKNVVLLGGRDFDKKEILRLKESGITVFSISEIDKFGMGEIMTKSLEIASRGTSGIHLSFDMDVVSPADAPGVSTPVHSGLSSREAFLIAEMAAESGKLLSIDMVEINAILDAGNRTATLACELVLSLLGKKVF